MCKTLTVTTWTVPTSSLKRLTRSNKSVMGCDDERLVIDDNQMVTIFSCGSRTQTQMLFLAITHV